MSSPGRKLALYNDPAGARLVIIDFQPLHRVCGDLFVLICPYALDRIGRKKHLKPFVHPFPSEGLHVISCADCSSAAIYEFIFTYNYYISGHTDDVGMKRQLAMIWQFLVYDSQKHVYRYDADAIQTDAEALFASLGDGTLGMSFSASRDFVSSESCPSYDVVDKLIPLTKATHKLEEMTENNLSHPNMFRVVKDAKELGIHAFPSQVSLTASIEGALTHLGTTLYTQPSDTDRDLKQLRTRFDEAASGLQKFICNGVSTYISQKVGSNLKVLVETKSALPLMVLQRANTFAPYKVKADVRMKSATGPGVAIELKTRWSGITPTKRDLSHFSWQAVLQSLSTHTTISPADPGLLLAIIPNEERVASIKLRYFSVPRFEPSKAADVLLKQITTSKIDCVLNYGTIMLGTRGAAFKSIFQKTPLYSPTVRVRLEEAYSPSTSGSNFHARVVGGDTAEFNAPSTWVFKQRQLKEGRPYLLFDGTSLRNRAWVYDPCTYESFPKLSLLYRDKARATVAFLYVCSLLNNNSLVPEDFEPGSIRRFLESGPRIPISGGYLHLSFFEQVLNLLRFPPTHIRVWDQFDNSVVIPSLSIDDADAFARFILPPRRGPQSRQSTCILLGNATDRTLSIPTIEQNSDHMADTLTSFQSVL